MPVGQDVGEFKINTDWKKLRLGGSVGRVGLPGPALNYISQVAVQRGVCRSGLLHKPGGNFLVLEKKKESLKRHI